MTRFDAIDWFPPTKCYLVKRGNKTFMVPLTAVRNLGDPDWLDALAAAAEVAKMEGRV